MILPGFEQRKADKLAKYKRHRLSAFFLPTVFMGCRLTFANVFSSNIANYVDDPKVNGIVKIKEVFSKICFYSTPAII